MLQIKRTGDDTLSVDIASAKKRAAIARYLRESGTWLECVEGMRCVVVQFDSANTELDVAESVLQRQLSAAPKRPAANTTLIEIPVCYGGEYGPEFKSICEMLDLTADELIGIHTSRVHRVVLIGFTPGFAYVSGLNDDLKIPRLTEPRQRVPAGSVGVAAGLTGLYALAGPGGWPLIGRTPVALFNPGDKQPFVLQAGMKVRFKAIDEIDFRCRMSP